MKNFLILFGIFVTCAALAEGFPSGTIVHCPFEDVPIEYIKQGTPVFSFDSEGSHCIERVLKIFEKDTDTLIRIRAEKEDFFAAPDQLFLLSDNTWRAAVDLQVGDGLRRVGGVSSVIDLEIIDVSGTNAQLHTLFISGTQNFSITKSGFYVHNIVPAVIVVAGVVVKSALAVALEAVAEEAAVVGIGYGGAYLHSKYKERQTRRPRDLSPEDMVRQKILDDEYNRQHCIHLEDLYDPTKYTKQSDGTYISVSDDTWWGRIFGQRLKPEDFQSPTNPGGKKSTSCGCGGGRPPDPPDGPRWKRTFRSERKPNPNGIYKDAPYHKDADGPKKSCRPTNGQHALDNSFPIKKTSPHRIAISGDKFVVLNQTLPGEFHGHLRDWAQLTPKMKAKLIAEGLVTHTGKIIKGK